MVSKFLTILDFIQIPASICAGLFGFYLWLHGIASENKPDDNAFCALFYLPLLFGVLTWVILGWLKTRTLKIRFSKVVAEYGQIYLKGNVKPSEIMLQPYIRGCILPIVVSAAPDMFAKLYDELPRKIRALNPEDVGTIVFISEIDHQVGKYDDRYAAYVVIWHIRIFDAQLGVTIDVRSFTGGNPPQISNGTAKWGSSPVGDVAGYLSNLPRVSKGM